MDKVYKVVTQDNGTITFYGDNEWIEFEYGTPEWADNTDDVETCFVYEGVKYFLSEIMRIEKNAPEYMQEFNGYKSETFFSGIVVKLHDSGDCVQVYTYCS